MSNPIGKKVVDTPIYSIYQLEDSDFEAFSEFIVDNEILWDVSNRDLWDAFGAPFFYWTKNEEPYALMHIETETFTGTDDVHITRTDEIKDIIEALDDEEEIRQLDDNSGDKRISRYVNQRESNKNRKKR